MSKEYGVEAIPLRDLGLRDAPDIGIFQAARKAQAVVISKDSDFVELVVPELQRRGVYKLDYRPGTLREKLFGRARLPDNHPAAKVRR